MANNEDVLVFTVQALVTGSDKTTVEVTSQIMVNEADKRITSIIKHSLLVISMDFLLYNSVTKVTI